MTSVHGVSLQRKLEADLNAITSCINTENIPSCPDDNELASRIAEYEISTVLKKRNQSRIEELRDALWRLSIRDYGVCQECGENISVSRLLAYPATKFCINCQEEFEKKQELEHH